MRLHTCTGAPSPRRVTLYLDLKGISLDQVEVDLRAGEHMRPAFAARSPNHTVPVLELDDGSCIWESSAIRRYLERLHPEPPLFGVGPEAQAAVDCWIDWVFLRGLIPVMEAFRNHFPGFRDHALPGPRPVAQIPALAERGHSLFGYFLEDLEQHLQETAWLAGDHLSVADIDALVTIEFAERGIKSGPTTEHAAIAAWRERFQERLNAAA
ncbi:MAG: glutathione S-transferase family protein [Wenzhouxiangella sp.]|nr:glutathione S-transferase family protein [Wenzhouxiangella sp.]MCH8477080.1 glutathione S-transferase family protein [Wenzhouxiangella sp.]TVR94226.1 MAG: glutathione S-transferase family protein [Wenzhouxiangellaceae bacterium]